MMITIAIVAIIVALILGAPVFCVFAAAALLADRP